MFDFIIKSKSELLLKEFPESIETKSGNKAKIEMPRMILSEFEGKYAVGVTVNASVRVFAPTPNGFSVTEKREGFGELECLSSDSTIKDIADAVNNLVDRVLKTIEAWG